MVLNVWKSLQNDRKYLNPNKKAEGSLGVK